MIDPRWWSLPACRRCRPTVELVTVSRAVSIVDAAAEAAVDDTAVRMLSAMVELVTVSVPRVVDTAAAAAGKVIGDGGVGDRQRAGIVVDAAAAGMNAELLSMVELVTVSVPPLSMPPPLLS